jgi:hypothetical protein
VYGELFEWWVMQFFSDDEARLPRLLASSFRLESQPDIDRSKYSSGRLTFYTIVFTPLSWE